MALKLGELVAFITGDKTGLDKTLVEAQAEMSAAGAKGSEGFTRDATGRLRDARGRFVTEGEQLGRGISDGLTRGGGQSSGWLGSIGDAARRMGEQFQSARTWVQNASERVSDFAGNVTSAVGSVWSIVQVLGILAAVAALAVPAIGLLGGALGSLPALAVGGGAALAVLGIGTLGLADAFKKTHSAGGAVVDTAHQVAIAERNLTDAQIGALRAQEQLDRARQAAAKNIADLGRALDGAHLDEEAAVLAVADAQKALDQAQRTGTPDQVKHADLAYRQAEQTLIDVRARLADTEQQQKAAAAAGVEGSDQVKTALDQQRKATESVTDAQYALQQAQKPPSGGGGAAAQTTKLAESAAQLVAVLKALKPAWESLRLDIQQRLFAGVGGEVRSLAGVWLPVLHDKLGGTATTFNGLFKLFAGSIKKPEFIAGIEKGLDSVDRLIDKVGSAVAGPFVDAFGRLSGAAGPFLDALGGELAGLVTDFANWIKSADESGRLESFMKKAGDFLHDVFHIGRDVGAIVGDIMHALFSDPKNSKGGSTWESLQKNLDDLKKWFDNPDNQKKIQDWFQKLQDAGKVFLLVVGWIADLMLWLDKVDKRFEGFLAGAVKLGLNIGHAFRVAWDDTIGFLSGLPDRIGKVTSGMWDGIKNSFRSAVNYVIGGWNRLHFTIGGGSFMGVNVPSFTLNTPDIPYLAEGGIVRATPGGRLVGVAEGGEDEVVSPLSKLAEMLRGGTQRVVFETGGDPVLDALFKVIRYKVKGDYGGDVNAAFAGA